MGRKKVTSLTTIDASLTIGYCRVSTQGQAEEGVSLDGQKNTIIEAAKKKGLVLKDIIIEDGVSASIPLKNRPGGSKIFQAIKEKTVRTVVATKLDRLFRDTLDCLEITREWEKQGIRVLLLDIDMDFSTPMGKAFLTSQASFAELERNLISARTKDGLKQVKREGVKLGGTGLGWRRKPDEVDEKGRFQQELVLEELEVIRRIKNMREDGHTFQSICDHLVMDNVKTKNGGKWWPATVKKICLLDIKSLEPLNK